MYLSGNRTLNTMNSYYPIVLLFRTLHNFSPLPATQVFNDLNHSRNAQKQDWRSFEIFNNYSHRDALIWSVAHDRLVNHNRWTSYRDIVLWTNILWDNLLKKSLRLLLLCFDRNRSGKTVPISQSCFVRLAAGLRFRIESLWSVVELRCSEECRGKTWVTDSFLGKDEGMCTEITDYFKTTDTSYALNLGNYS